MGYWKLKNIIKFYQFVKKNLNYKENVGKIK